MERCALIHGVVTDGVNVFLEDGAIIVKDGEIEKIAPTYEIRSFIGNTLDVKGRLVIPGLLNAHHHLYSTLAVGLSPVGDVNNFVNILENLWWRLDKVLDDESIYYSALLGVIDAVKHGTTMIFDHHASMNFVKGSLFILEEVFKQAGIKGTLCFETSARSGEEKVEEHIRENIEFYEKHRSSDTLKGMMGLHANLTLTEKTLRMLQEEKPEDMPVHIHCGEDGSDMEYAKSLGYKGVVHRLVEHDLLTKDSILAHAIYLTEEDYRLIKEIKPVIVANPESNANNQVGRLDREKIKEYVLGTDGMSCDMIATLRSHYLLGKGIREDFEALKKVFFDYRYKIQKYFFPDTGEFKEGYRADITVLDYVPVTPINKDNIIGHLLFGVREGRVFITMSDGEIIYKDGRVTFVDEEEVLKKAKIIAKKLHERYYG